ncbi:MAG: 1-acyl-sn-glycerol-3-phosphate acyltransferase [Myxococcaceae bacterium]|nr:1-acyl-sn-glycerol-3-phosphate acyltransferase [Myxococcaceae bacterium]
MNPFRSLFAGPAAAGITGFFSPIVAGLSFYDELAADPVLFAWATSILKVAGVKTVARGLEKLPPGNFVLAVNHQSHFDALVLFRHIRRHMRFVAKRELTKIPIFGQAMRKAGNIVVDRRGTDADKKLLREAIEAVQTRVSICFFAEGTRSDDGVLRPFKKGAAVFAIDAQVPLVPAALAGTHEILPKGTLQVRARPAALVIGDPIDTTGMTHDDRDRLTSMAHAAVAKQLQEAQALLPLAE